MWPFFTDGVSHHFDTAFQITMFYSHGNSQSGFVFVFFVSKLSFSGLKRADSIPVF